MESSSEGKLTYHPVITITTDFGTNDHFVGAMKGVIVDIVPEAQIVDISHAVQPFDVLDGALTIAQAYSYFPNGTIHLVVDAVARGRVTTVGLDLADDVHDEPVHEGPVARIGAFFKRVRARLGAL